ncbi:MAG: hypothetical protein OEY49_06285 [Candidatus Heimdallarchaeota archaeon]|nr:hypothetical protein [Candidatus Heimdallarchaeota archaeon]
MALLFYQSSILFLFITLFICHINFKVLKRSFSTPLANILLGTLGSSIYLVLTILPLLIFHDISTIDTYNNAIVNKRTPLFWILILISLFSEATRFLATKNEKYTLRTINGMVVFGLGWSIVEFFGKFLWFFENTDNYMSNFLLLFTFILLFNVGVSIIIIRAEENTRFVMFTAFLKFFIEMAIYGGFGYVNDFSLVFSRLYFMLFLIYLLVLLSLVTRKPISSSKVVSTT